MFVVISDFNAKLSQWLDKDSSTSGGISFENITSQFGLDQIINEPTHILENSSLCIDQIIYAKFNLEILYLPPSTREVWYYKDSNVDLIRQSINEFDWNRAFANKHVAEKILIFNKTVLNILSNFIPQEVIVCDDKDPSWFNGKIKLLIDEKLRTYNA